MGIFDIKGFAIHYGPRIRTTVFVKTGCPLHCPWCHNPEGISRKAEISFSPERCLRCGAYLDICPSGAHWLDGNRRLFERPLCQACRRCAKVCPSGAYEESGGGLTISGRKPLHQFEFTWGQSSKTFAALTKRGAKLVLRCPIIPGVNDTNHHLRGVAELALSLLERARRWGDGRASLWRWRGGLCGLQAAT